MAETWEEQYVDKQLDRAWMELRLRLADRIDAVLPAGDMEQITLIAPGRKAVSIGVDDGVVVVDTPRVVYTFENADEAAYTVYRILHDEWQVIHPAFLDLDDADLVPAFTAEPADVPDPGADLWGKRLEAKQARLEAAEKLADAAEAALLAALKRMRAAESHVKRLEGEKESLRRIARGFRDELEAMRCEVSWREHQLDDLRAELEQAWSLVDPAPHEASGEDA